MLVWGSSSTELAEQVSVEGLCTVCGHLNNDFYQDEYYEVTVDQLKNENDLILTEVISRIPIVDGNRSHAR
jgi:hypothetical protein